MKLTNEDFLRYARSRKADERYTYLSYDRCAVAQYLRAQDSIIPIEVGGFEVHVGLSRARLAIPEPLSTLAAFGEHTWGALTNRLARALNEIEVEGRPVAEVIAEAKGA